MAPANPLSALRGAAASCEDGLVSAVKQGRARQAKGRSTGETRHNVALEDIFRKLCKAKQRAANIQFNKAAQQGAKLAINDQWRRRQQAGLGLCPLTRPTRCWHVHLCSDVPPPVFASTQACRRAGVRPPPGLRAGGRTAAQSLAERSGGQAGPLLTQQPSFSELG